MKTTDQPEETLKPNNFFQKMMISSKKKTIHILFEILDTHGILTKQKFILLQNGLSFLKNECGMCAPVNSIIAADLKQLDECVFSQRNLRQHTYVLLKEMKVSRMTSKTSDILPIRPVCQFQIVRC